MVRCPRCEQPVDETVRTTCPICFTPLFPEGTSAAPPAAAPPPAPEPLAPAPPVDGLAGAAPVAPAVPAPSGVLPTMPPAAPSQPVGPQVPPPAPRPTVPLSGERVSLTGERISPAMPPAGPSAPVAPGGYAGGSAAGVPPMRPASPTAPRMSGPGPVVQAAPAKSSSGPIVALLVVLVLIAGGAFGGWWWMMHRTNPKDQALKVMTSLKNADWQTFYSLLELSENQKKQIPNAKALEDQSAAGMGGTETGKRMVQTVLNSIDDITVGEPTIEGNTATVPVSFSINVMGQKMNNQQSFPMKNVGGTWKLDASTIGTQFVGGGGFGGAGRR